jgi:hypothetical protein
MRPFENRMVAFTAAQTTNSLELPVLPAHDHG